MRWLRRGLLALVVLLVAIAAAAYALALKGPRPTGFQVVKVVTPDGQAFPMGVWYPTDATPWPTALAGLNLMDVARDAPVAGSALPLVVISHGNGGGPFSHADLALELAGHGFVVAAPMHPGDNFADQRALQSATWFVNRTREVHSAIDFMLAAWPAHEHIDPARVGIYGFSAGGFTALAAIGGVPDLRRIAAHCLSAPEFACRLLADAHSPLLVADNAPPASAYVHDPRIKAAVVAAPGIGFTFTTEGLSGITAPVQLWSGAADASVPTATNAGWVHDALGSRADLHVVPGAGHFAFLVPCGLGGPPLLCRDEGGFDRKAFHEGMNRDVVAFFRARL